jgi:hypothetical protein
VGTIAGMDSSGEDKMFCPMGARIPHRRVRIESLSSFLTYQKISKCS